MAKPFDKKLNEQYNEAGKQLVKRQLGKLCPTWVFVPEDEKFSARDLLFVDPEGCNIGIEVEARKAEDWIRVWDRSKTMRFPQRKDPDYRPQCKWDLYFQVCPDYPTQGLFLDRGSLEDSSTETQMCRAGSWRGADRFTVPKQDKVDFYEIDGDDVYFYAFVNGILQRLP